MGAIGRAWFRTTSSRPWHHRSTTAGCGYSLREIDSSRCPECGEAIDRERLDTPRDEPRLVRRDSPLTLAGCLAIPGYVALILIISIFWIYLILASVQAPFWLLLVLLAAWLITAVVPIAVIRLIHERWAERDLKRRQDEQANAE